MFKSEFFLTVAEAYLGPCELSMMEPSFKNIRRLKANYYFSKKALWKLFGKVLNTLQGWVLL